MAATVECLEGRHVTGGSPASSTGGGRELSALAAAPAENAARADLPVGHRGQGYTRFRYLDENGYAIHRYLVARARLEDHSAHYTARTDGQRSSQVIHLVPTQ